MLDDFGREAVPLVAYFLHPLGYLTASEAASPNCRDNAYRDRPWGIAKTVSCASWAARV